MSDNRFLSGIQPTGEPHLGNYFGAIRKHVENQDNAFYFIADYHALTSIHDPVALRDLVQDVAITYLSLGLDPSRAVLFRQSDVPEVTEIAWLLSTVCGMGLLERAHSFKDKKARGMQTNVGLFTYPILMAADILAYDSDIVPVGKDQVQHLEMTRDMARAFNERFGTEDAPIFKLPQTVLGVPEVVPGIDGQKMSKSYGNTIPVFASGKRLKKLVMGIKTDSTPMEEAMDPKVCTVFEMFSLLATEEERAELATKYARPDFGYGHAKLALLEQLKAHFAEAHARREALLADPAQVEAALTLGANRARAAAREVLNRARRACGLD